MKSERSTQILSASRRDHSQPTGSAPRSEALVSNVLERPRVLCVDDERGVLDGLRMQLGRHYDFLCANSGAEALHILRDTDVSVIVSDMRMPMMDGAEFLNRARKLRPDTARILLTGQADLGSAMRAVNEGQVFQFLLKPCTPTALLAAIADGASRHKSAVEGRNQRQDYSQELAFLEHHDVLTRLPGRKLFLERSDQLLNNARALGQRMGLLLLNLRHFRSLNETLGQTTCDAILRGVAERLKERATSVEAIGRVGGDRFALAIVEPQPSWAPSALLASPLCNPLDVPLMVGGQSLQIGATVGLSMFPEDGDDADSLLCNAEAAMKRARASGQRARGYTRELGVALSQRIKLELRLRQAVEQAEFQLHYQPKIDLRSGSICGAEGLLRWHSPDLGMVPPAQFVPVLEETGLIVEVGGWALRQAASDRRLWISEGLTVPPLAVNVSPLQLDAGDFVETTLTAIGAESAGISLEITESMLMTDMDDKIEKLRRLRNAGISIAIDDFGTGYSSLAYLSRLPVTAIKIDRSFVIRIGDSADTVSIVLAIISLARALGLKVIAEGVDNPEQLKFLRLLRCDEFQGYLFSKAVPPTDFGDLLRQGRRMAFD